MILFCGHRIADGPRQFIDTQTKFFENIGSDVLAVRLHFFE
jgi:hypothetical protein